MIATVTLNPCLDKTITVNGLKIDEANRWQRIRRDPAGKGINVSRAIHEMGGNTVAYGFIGGPDGRIIEILLDEEGVHYDFTPIHAETRTNFIISDAKTGQQTRIDAPGPSISKGELNRLRRKLRNINPPPDFMVISGSMPPGVPADTYKQLIEESKVKGIKTVLDSDGEWLRKGILAEPYLVKPNVYEVEQLLQTNLLTEDAIIRAAYTLLDMHIEVVVISRGKDGFIAVTNDLALKVLPPRLKVQSSVGAGDCTVAGIVMELARGKTLIEACRLGGAMGAAAVLTPATQLCRRKDVERILPQVKIEEIDRDTVSKRIDSGTLPRLSPGKPSPATTITVNRTSPGDELSLRRMRVDEAMPTLDHYLNRAFVAGLRSVRIIHGKGTGTIRQAVIQHLTNHPLIKSYRPARLDEGGAGVTVAELANH